jgi:hypothetical protein
VASDAFPIVDDKSVIHEKKYYNPSDETQLVVPERFCGSFLKTIY